jgi:hypothetical protein
MCSMAFPFPICNLFIYTFFHRRPECNAKNRNNIHMSYVFAQWLFLFQYIYCSMAFPFPICFIYLFFFFFFFIRCQMKSNILCLFFIYNLKNLKEYNVENHELCVFYTILKQKFPKHKHKYKPKHKLYVSKN